jgi:hypothetical protein
VVSAALEWSVKCASLASVGINVADVGAHKQPAFRGSQARRPAIHFLPPQFLTVGRRQRERHFIAADNNQVADLDERIEDAGLRLPNDRVAVPIDYALYQALSTRAEGEVVQFP